MRKAVPWDNCPLKADTLGFVQALFQIGHAAHFPAQTYLTDGDKFIADRAIQQRGDHAQTDSKVASGIPQCNAAHNVDVNIQIAKEIPCPLFQHSDQKVHAVIVVSAAGAAGCREIRLGSKRLYLAQDGAAALHGAGYTVAGNAQRTPLQKHLRGVFDLGKPCAGHIKHSQLIGGAVAVFGCPQNAVRQHLVALKVEHRIHNMLHNLWTCDCAILVHVTHDEHGNFLLFGDCQQPGSTFLHLTDRAGRGGNVHTAHGLDGVDDHKLRLFLFNQTADLIYIVFCRQKDVILRYLQPRSAQLDLPDRFLAGDIQHTVLVGDRTAQL